MAHLNSTSGNTDHTFAARLSYSLNVSRSNFINNVLDSPKIKPSLNYQTEFCSIERNPRDYTGELLLNDRLRFNLSRFHELFRRVSKFLGQRCAKKRDTGPNVGGERKKIIKDLR